MKYRVQKAKCPYIGACILLPAKYGSPFLKGMTQFKRYARNTPLFTDVKTGQTMKAKCDFVVWIDPPVQQPATPVATAANSSDASEGAEPDNRPTTTHTMQLLGSIASVPARVLFDTGAEQHNYISAQFCRNNGIAICKAKRPLRIAGIAGAAADTTCKCTATLRMQGLNVQLSFAVIDMPAAFDVILGDAWLKSLNAKLDFATATCAVNGKGKKPVTLYMDTPRLQPTEQKGPAVLSYTQARRICKHEFWHCLVVVRQLPPAADSNTAVAGAATVTDPDPKVQQLQAEYPTVFTDSQPHGGSKLQIDYELIPTAPGSGPVLRPM